MNENLIWWSSQLFTSAADFVIIYVIAHAFVWKHIRVKKEHVFFGTIFTIVSGLAFYLFDGWSARIISHIFMILILKKMIVHTNLEDLFIVYLANGVILGVVQGAIVVTLLLFDPSRSFTFVVGQSLTTIAIIGVCKMFKWHRVFHAVRSNIILKLILVILFFTTLVTMFILNFNFDLAYIFFSSVAIILVSVVLSPIFMRVYQKVNGIISVEDIKTDLFTTAIDMIEESDAEVRYQIYAELAAQYGVDVSSFPEDKKRSEENRTRMEMKGDKIRHFIHRKIKSSEQMLEIDSDITYYEEHKDVDFEECTTWLNVLLDQALQTATSNPICIYLLSMDDTFRLEVESECNIVDWRTVKAMLEQGCSSNDGSHGARLHALYTKAIALGGSVVVKPYYMTEHACHYLQISIKLEKKEDHYTN